MLRWLERNRRSARIGRQLYEGIVAQARCEAFFRDLAVPDTMDGRFEVIVLHIVLVLRRLKAEGPEGQRVGQALLEQFIAAMDDALRQIGIGDMGVPPRVQRAAAALHERARDYGQALDGASSDAPAALAEAVRRHLYEAPNDNAAALPLQRAHADTIARYVCASATTLAARPADALYDGNLAFATLGTPSP
jgi:cytochrome b pre-mRNA-processing protein 3